jgi:hypothetical protein
MSPVPQGTAESIAHIQRPERKRECVVGRAGNDPSRLFAMGSCQKRTQSRRDAQQPKALPLSGGHAQVGRHGFVEKDVLNVYAILLCHPTCKQPCTLVRMNRAVTY